MNSGRLFLLLKMFIWVVDFCPHNMAAYNPAMNKDLKNKSDGKL